MGVEYHYDVIQDTDEWRALRRGLITGSIMGQLVTPSTMKIADNKDTRTIIYELAAQRLMSEMEENFQSWDMVRGKKEEVLAKDLYSRYYKQVKDCGFITNDRFGFKIGYSPDGLVGDDGGIEAKSRVAKYQVKTIIDGLMPIEFLPQVQSFFLVSERKWCDFISYSNGMHMFPQTVEPIKEWQEALSVAVVDAEKKIIKVVDDYKQRTRDLVKADWIDVMSEERGDIKPSANANFLMAG